MSSETSSDFSISNGRFSVQSPSTSTLSGTTSILGPDGAGREAGVADAGRDERVVGEVDAAAYADH